jgi:hypothetical protein
VAEANSCAAWLPHPTELNPNTDVRMSIMYLSVSSVCSVVKGAAGIALMVSVTHEDGTPYTGLGKKDFTVKWIVDAADEQPLKSVTVREYEGPKLPNMPGVYAVEVQSKSSSWTPTSSNIVTFYIAVVYANDHGQILYTVTDPSIALGP